MQDDSKEERDETCEYEKEGEVIKKKMLKEDEGSKCEIDA